MSRPKINADTAALLLTLQAMAFSSLCFAGKVDGTLSLLGYGLAVLLFVFVVLIFTMDAHEDVGRSTSDT